MSVIAQNEEVMAHLLYISNHTFNGFKQGEIAYFGS